MFDVLVGAGGVHDQEQVVALIGDHQVVKDPAALVREQPVALTAPRQPLDIGGNQRLQRLRRTLAAQDHLPHVAHVEQARRGAGVQMLVQHPHRVLHRHVPAGKWHHLRAERSVQVVKRRAAQVVHRHPPLQRDAPRTRCPLCPCPTLRQGAPEIVILRRAAPKGNLSSECRADPVLLPESLPGRLLLRPWDVPASPGIRVFDSRGGGRLARDLSARASLRAAVPAGLRRPSGGILRRRRGRRARSPPSRPAARSRRRRPRRSRRRRGSCGGEGPIRSA